MNDVSTLMGKLKANVAYLAFSDTATEEKSTWPVLDRMARALKHETASMDPAPAQPAAVAAPGQGFAERLEAAHVSAAQPAESAAPVQQAAAAPASPVGGILRRYSAAATDPQPSAPAAVSTTSAEPRVLSDIFAQLERKAP